jgi:hypothetical protein
VDVGVDQAGQHELVAQIDDLRTGVAGGIREAITNRFDLAIADEKCGCATWRLSGPVEQATRVHDHDRIRIGLRRRMGGHCETQHQDEQAE